MVIHSGYAYTIFGKPGFNQQELAASLAAKVLGSTKYTHEWQPGMTMEQVKKKIGPGIFFRDNGEYTLK